uniref:hypothetical protein n=1 Tax=Gordonia sp. B7-2 TaxID=3420932 RepID=UPI003D8A083A
MSVIRRSAIAMLVALSIAVGGATVATPPAQAITGWIYISFPKWLGNCPAGGSVFAILAAVGNTWTTGGKFDWGDDLVYAKVNLNKSQQVSAQVWCAKKPGKTKPERFPISHAVTQSIKPTRNGQTVWVGLSGVRY